MRMFARFSNKIVTVVTAHIHQLTLCECETNFDTWYLLLRHLLNINCRRPPCAARIVNAVDSCVLIKAIVLV